jgi:hypothetical protein
MPFDELCAAAAQPVLRRQFRGRRFYLTPDVAALGPALVTAAMAAVVRFEWFERTSQLGGEHHGGRMIIGDQPLVWQVSCYDRPWRPRPLGTARLIMEVRVVTLLTAAEAAARPKHPSPVEEIAASASQVLTARGWAFPV